MLGSTTHQNHVRQFATTRSDQDLDDVEHSSDEGQEYMSDGSEVISMQEDTSDDEADDIEESCQKTRKPSPKEHVSYDYSSDLSDEEEDLVNDGRCDDLRAKSLLDVETYKDISEGTGDTKRPLWMRIQEATGNTSLTLRKIIDDWIGEGNPISRAVVIYTITVLRRRKKYWRALEV